MAHEISAWCIIFEFFSCFREIKNKSFPKKLFNTMQAKFWDLAQTTFFWLRWKNQHFRGFFINRSKICSAILPDQSCWFNTKWSSQDMFASNEPILRDFSILYRNLDYFRKQFPKLCNSLHLMRCAKASILCFILFYYILQNKINLRRSESK